LCLRLLQGQDGEVDLKSQNPTPSTAPRAGSLAKNAKRACPEQAKRAEGVGNLE
jgi:hypothetical protein